MKFFKSTLNIISICFSIVSSLTLDLSSMSKLNQEAHVQDYTSGRIQISNNILNIYMSPLDGDGNTGNSRLNGNRQRNEVSVTEPECVAKKYDTVKYEAQIYIPSDLNWNVPLVAWYHLFQIKKWGMGRPVVTVGVKHNKLVLYRCENYNYIVIGNIEQYKNKWFKVEFIVDVNDDISVDYNLLGKSGNIMCKKYVNKSSNYIYMKMGQYRYYPNPIDNIVTVRYSSVKCTKS